MFVELQEVANVWLSVFSVNYTHVHAHRLHNQHICFLYTGCDVRWTYSNFCTESRYTVPSARCALSPASLRWVDVVPLLTQVGSMCSWTLPCVSSLVPSVLHLSHGFQCSPTLNRQPYEGRLPLTSWWRKSSNMTVGQSSLISLAHHCYDWHPGSRCG